MNVEESIEASDLRGTNETIFSLVHLEYLTQAWNAQSSSSLASVKLSKRSGIPDKRARHSIRPVTVPVMALPLLSKMNLSVSVTSKSGESQTRGISREVKNKKPTSVKAHIFHSMNRLNRFCAMV